MELLELFLSFSQIGFTSFGGMSMIPLINSEMLSHGWMNATEVLDIVAIAEMTPGPLGLNCATFAGMRVAGIAGALAANLGMLAPTYSVCLVVAIFFDKFKGNRIMEHALYGIRPVCIGLISGVIVTLSKSNYFIGSTPYLQSVGIGLAVILVMWKWRPGVPLLIVMAALLGLIFVR